MNRPMQAEHTEGLMDLSGLSRSIMNPRKCLRPSEIIKSEEMVKRVQGIITETLSILFKVIFQKIIFTTSSPAGQSTAKYIRISALYDKKEKSSLKNSQIDLLEMTANHTQRSSPIQSNAPNLRPSKKASKARKRKMEKKSNGKSLHNEMFLGS